MRTMRDQIQTLDVTPEMLSDFDALARMIFKKFAEELSMILPCISMYEKKSDDLRFVYESTDRRVVELIQKYCNRSISDFIFPLTENDNALVKSFKTGRIVVEKSVKMLAYPYIQNNFLIGAIDKIIRLKMIVITPIMVNKQVIGVFAFGSREKDSLTVEDEHFLLRFSASVGGYLKNCWLLTQHLLENNILRQEKQQLLECIKINEEFLKNLNHLLEDIKNTPPNVLVSQDTIEKNILYLKSLILISRSLQHKDFE